MKDIELQHGPGFRFENLWIREQCFRDASGFPLEIDRLEDVQVSLEFKYELLADAQAGWATLQLRILPPNAKPDLFREIVVVVEGKFVASGLHDGVAKEFLSKNAPVVLFPFARQVVATLTAQSRFGQLLLPPINVQAMINTLDKGTVAAQ